MDDFLDICSYTKGTRYVFSVFKEAKRETVNRKPRMSQYQETEENKTRNIIIRVQTRLNFHLYPKNVVVCLGESANFGR